jgi:thiamine pyrophosphate-dependent acetolactate synthase large subunit-like protein
MSPESGERTQPLEPRPLFFPRAINDRDHLSLMCRRPAGARPCADRLRSGRPDHLRRLRPGRVRAVALEPRTQLADPVDRHAAGGGRRELPAASRARRQHRRSLERLLAAVEPRASGDHLEGHLELREALLHDLHENENDDGWPIKPQKAIFDLRRSLGPEDIVISDVGAHKVWAARLYQAYEPNTVIISNGFAAMGISLPGAIAAKLVHPEPKVVALAGDGAFMMNSQELETAKRIGTAITVVVWRDDAYGLIDWKQRNGSTVPLPSSSATRTWSRMRRASALPASGPPRRPTCTRP